MPTLTTRPAPLAANTPGESERNEAVTEWSSHSLTATLRRWPLVSYFAITFLLSWGGLFLVAGFSGLPLGGGGAASQTVLFSLPLIAAPAIAGILMTLAMDGRAGLRELVRRLTQWRVERRWYAVALLPIPLVMIAATAAFALGFDFPLRLVASDDRLGVVLTSAVASLVVATFEEIGWTGFATPRLRQRYGVIKAGLLLGAIWGAWHFPMFATAASFAAPLPAALLFAQIFSWLPPFRASMVWVYDRTGSLPLVTLIHAAVTFETLLLEPLTRSVDLLLASVLVLAAAQWILMFVLTTPNRIRLALAFGCLSVFLYTAMLVVVPLRWPGYSSASRAVSELSAIGAPSRSLWVPLGIVWAMLYAAFGWAIWKSAGTRRALRIAGGSILVGAVVGLFWPPMHMREVLAQGGGTLTDTLHLVWGAVHGLVTLLAMGFAAAAFGWRFRLYSVATMVILIVAGVMTSLDAPRLQANLTTPWIGVWERVNIGVWLIWIVSLTVIVWRRLPAKVVH